jgi:hypothetical protein
MDMDTEQTMGRTPLTGITIGIPYSKQAEDLWITLHIYLGLLYLALQTSAVVAEVRLEPLRNKVSVR